MVSGNYTGPANTGVAVNGTPAIVDGSRFFANLIPLTPGTNTIRVVVTTPLGNTMNSEVQVTATGEDVAEFRVSPEVGTAPLSARFSYRYSGGSPVQTITVDFEGDGIADLVTSDATRPIEHNYTSAGIYLPSITITDKQGNTYTRHVALQILDHALFEGGLTATYDRFKNALVCGTVEVALGLMTHASRDRYAPAFNALAPYLPQIVSTWSALQPADFGPSYAEYAINRMINGTNRLFFIYFVADDDGVWRIDSI